MARTPKAPKVLSKAEIKAKKADLTAARKTIQTELAKFVADHKAAVKGKEAAQKAADKAVAAAQKLVDAAEKKLGKANAAAEKGLAKIDGELAALAPAAE